ncbi:hypothetical protein GW17_00060234 [Ensete ventricosum]|nr:hypothetical protein GW17_00060234 [Ensete ventricosum]
MHPQRFPNGGIRAKVFVQKIGFKLRVMRLYHIGSFYAFLLHFYSESSEKGRPATASPHVGPATHGQAAAKAPLPAPARGRPTMARASPQGATLAGTAGYSHWQRGASKGAGCRAPARGCRPWPALPPVGATAPTAGVAAASQGNCRSQRADAAFVRATAVAVHWGQGEG